MSRGIWKEYELCHIWGAEVKSMSLWYRTTGVIGKAPEEQKESGSISQPQRLGLRAEGSHSSGSRTYPTLLHGHCKVKANSSSAKAKLCLWPEHRYWEGVPPEGAVWRHPGRADMGSNLWRWQTAAQGWSPELKVAARPRSLRAAH